MLTNRENDNEAEVARTASALNIMAGIWLVITPFWMGYYVMPTPLWNSLIPGGVVGVLALIRACYPAENVGLSWVNLLCGIWLIVSPFFLTGYDLTVPFRNAVIPGIVISVLSLCSALATASSGSYIRSPRS
jgi:hypothetical protein